MKLSTLSIALVHLIYIIGVMWLGPYIIYMKGGGNCKQMYVMVAWMIVIVFQVAHWAIPQMENECILSYWEKKLEDPQYVKGSLPSKTYAWVLLRDLLGQSVTIEQIRSVHKIASKVAFLFAISNLTLQNDCIFKSKHPNTRLFAYILGTIFAVKSVSFDSAEHQQNIK